MRTLVLLDPGPNWIAEASVAGQDRAVIASHLLRTRRLYDEGAVIFGGPTAEGFGGMLLVETETLDAARRLMDEDPAVLAGVMTFRLMALNPFFDAFAGRAWTPASV